MRRGTLNFRLKKTAEKNSAETATYDSVQQDEVVNNVFQRKEKAHIVTFRDRGQHVVKLTLHRRGESPNGALARQRVMRHKACDLAVDDFLEAGCASSAEAQFISQLISLAHTNQD